RPPRKRHHIPARRAQHEPRDAPLRPHHRPGSRRQARRRPTRRSPQRSPRTRRLPRRMSALLSLEGVVAGYGQGDILCGIDLTVEEGSVTCLVGPNGAGKSTVLRTVSGLLHPRDGRVTLAGEDISRATPVNVLLRGVVHVTQDRSLFPLMTVWDN